MSNGYRVATDTDVSDDYRVTSDTDERMDVFVYTRAPHVVIHLEGDDDPLFAKLTVTQALAAGNELIRRASAIQGSNAASAQAWHGTDGPR